jgi:ADP-ribosylglycohydrolase
MTCEGSVPQAITAFLESEDYEDTIRKAISIGGDSDTIACIAGGIAEAFYGGVPQDIADFALAKLDDTLREIIAVFEQAHSISR